jgi:hypothetical protein
MVNRPGRDQRAAETPAYFIEGAKSIGGDLSIQNVDIALAIISKETITTTGHRLPWSINTIVLG